MKNFTLLFTIVLLAAACERQDANVTSAGDGAAFRVTRSEAASASAQTWSVYVYASQLDTLHSCQKDLPIASTTLLEIPKYQNFKAIAIANASGIVSGEEFLSTLTIDLAADPSREVFASNIKLFESGGPTIVLDLARRVGAVSFQPVESPSEIEAVTQFDSIAVTFSGVTTKYTPASPEEPETGDVTLGAKKADGFSVKCHVFRSEAVGMSIDYFLDGVKVNSTDSDLSTVVTVIPSRETIFRMSLFEEDFLESPFASGGAPAGIVKVSYAPFNPAAL